MSEAFYELIAYRLKRSQEALEEAIALAGIKHWNACVNRLYYACFYVVSALLVFDNLSSSKHTGIRGLFNQYYVRPQWVSKEIARIYNDLFERRHEGDYVDFFEFQEAQVSVWIPLVEEFVTNIKSVIEQKKQETEKPS